MATEFISVGVAAPASRTLHTQTHTRKYTLFTSQVAVRGNGCLRVCGAVPSADPCARAVQVGAAPGGTAKQRRRLAVEVSRGRAAVVAGDVMCALQGWRTQWRRAWS